MRGQGADRLLEQTRVVAISLEVSRKANRFGRKSSRFHHAHGRMNAQRARFVGRGGHDAATNVVAQDRKASNALTRFRIDQVIGLQPPPATNHDGSAA